MGSVAGDPVSAANSGRVAAAIAATECCDGGSAAEEKKADKTGKNKSKAQLKGGNSKGYDAMQTNKILENDLIGDDGYGEEDDSKPFKREEEAEFDFM